MDKIVFLLMAHWTIYSARTASDALFPKVVLGNSSGYGVVSAFAFHAIKSTDPQVRKTLHIVNRGIVGAAHRRAIRDGKSR